MSRLLIDTHVLLWALLSPSKLSHRARNLVRDPANTILVSSVSAWELATKHRLGKLPHAAEVVEDLQGHLRRFLAEELAINTAHALTAGNFRCSHRDPFDRMLAAQSLIEGVPIVTNDEAFHQFPISTIWA